MSKGNKFGMSLPTDAIAEMAAMQRKMNPMAGIETGAIKAARDMQRRMNPLGGIEAGALAQARELERFGSLHRSMFDHVTLMTGGEAFQSQLAAMQPTIDAMNAMKPAMDAMNTMKPMLEAARASSQLSDLHRTIGAQYGAINGLDDLRRGLTGILGESGSLRSSLDVFTRVRDRLGGSLGLDVATQWDRLAAATAIPSVAALSFPFAQATSVMTLTRTAADVLGTLAWLEPALDEEEDEDDPPRVVVVALHSRKPAGPQAWRALQIATGAAINCSNCGEPFDLNLKLWLTGEDLEVFFQGEMLPICGSCGGDGGLLLDSPMRAPYRVIDGGREGDEKAIGKLSLVVKNTPEGEDE